VRLVVLGDPVAHSLSPRLHTAALAATGIPGTYTARQVDHAGMERAADELRRGELDGANITMPHKLSAARISDRLAGPARRTGAVNTWVRVAGDVVGHNTDVTGIGIAWRRAGLPEAAPVLVIGAGGAAAAAVVALDGRDLAVTARRSDAVQRLAGTCDVRFEIVPWGEGRRGSVVVNATPVGMRGERLPAPLLADAVGLLDMAYGGGTTPAVREMASRGLPVADGEEMLLGQAMEAFRLWTGRPAPIEAMRGALTADPPGTVR
jgi:shikimate dehydrogenase